jgi:hypothetical protein
MTKVIGVIEKYDGNNVYVAGKTFFIPASNLPSALANFPAGTVIALDTMPKQPGTVDWIRLLTKDEKAAYEKTKMVDPLPDPAFKTGKEILQENLEKAAVPPFKPPVSKVPLELDREREEYNARAKGAPDPAPVLIHSPEPKLNPGPVEEPYEIPGAVSLKIHINLGSFCNFELGVEGSSGEHACALLVQESKRTLPVVANIIAEAMKASWKQTGTYKN